jgi:hypothetical protein
MAHSDTTSLDALPTSSGEGDPVQLVARDVANELRASVPAYNPSVGQSQTGNRQSPHQLINQADLVRSLNGPSASGSTSFPESHVIASPVQHQTAQIRQQEYYPRHEERGDYIGTSTDAPQIPQPDKNDHLYDTFKIPILVAAAFFIYQTPPVRRLVRTLLPTAVSTTGGYSMQSQLLSSVVFGGSVYGGIWLLDNVSP